LSDYTSKKDPHLEGLFAARLPTDLVIRIAAAQDNANRKILHPMDPYSVIQKARFEDAFRADPIVKIATIRKAQFMLGKRIKSVLDVSDDLATLQELANQKAVADFTQQTNDYNQKQFEQQQQQQGQMKQLADENRQQRLHMIHNPAMPSLKQMLQQKNAKLHLHQLVLPEPKPPITPKPKLPAQRNAPPGVPPAGGGGTIGDPGAGGAGGGLGSTGGTGTIPTIYDPEVQAQLELEPLRDDDRPQLLDVTNLPLEKLQNMALQAVMTDQEYLHLKNEIDKTNRRVDFHAKSMALVIQSSVGGRSAGLIESGPDGMPMDISILNWQRLGQVILDENTGHLAAVRYMDWSETENIIDANRMLYFPRYDVNISPNSMYYGLSDVEPVAHDSETNRIMSEMDFKEMARSLWAGVGVIKMANKDPAVHDRLLSNMTPGGWISTDLDTVVEVHQIARNFQEMINARSETDKRILAALEVPTFLVGFEDVTNRATTEQVLLAWKESVLEHQRTWYRGIVERQWFDSMTSIILNEPDIEALKVKVKCEFEDITFETLVDKATAVLPLYEAGILPMEKVLKMLDMDDVIEEMRVMKQQYAQAKAKMLKEQQQAALEQQQQQQAFGSPTGTAPPNGNGNAQQPQQPQKTDTKSLLQNVVPPQKKGRVDEIDGLIETAAEVLDPEGAKRSKELDETNLKIANAKLEFITKLSRQLSDLA
jgi:hypothetical protein